LIIQSLLSAAAVMPKILADPLGERPQPLDAPDVVEAGLDLLNQ